MLEIKDLCKSYKTGNFEQRVLRNINLKFRKSEFVAILGPSGSGKTTLLNIIGGLDRYDSGDLIIKGKSTKRFRNRDFDAYRNNSIGFIFQSYNLISHISILNNVEMGMTLSGKRGRKRKRTALDLLNKVGLGAHVHKRPNELSGGQMQRVAIARALANEPEIILADEPTGALDTKTSIQIMNLIKQISKNKLVIMVTHNRELAENYADRIIRMQDGEIISDSNPLVVEGELNTDYRLKKTAMNRFTALHLSLNNIRTKKGRTLLTAFASSIGIIGIALILSLSNGFSKQIDLFEQKTSDAMPVLINRQKISSELIAATISESTGVNMGDNENNFPEGDSVTQKENKTEAKLNNLSNRYIKYLGQMPESYVSSVEVEYGINPNLVQKNEDKFVSLSELKVKPDLAPYKNFNDDSLSPIFENYYDILAGRYPKDKTELILEIGSDNSISEEYKKALGLEGEKFKFSDILNSEITYISNNDAYQELEGFFIPKEITDEVYNNSLKLKIVGIIRIKEDKADIMSSSTTLYYTNMLAKYIMEESEDTDVVKKQKEADYNIFTMQKFEEGDTGIMTKEAVLASLGAKTTPQSIYIFPKDFENKNKIIKYLDRYNKAVEEDDKVSYLDQAELITNISDGIMDGITLVLVAFSSISLIVSSIMLGIITYISVLERTKEIGILRSLGARRKDIRRVFNAETSIIGFTSGLIGIGVALLLIVPINQFIFEQTKLENVAVLDPKHAIALIAISIILTLIGGAIPARIASKKNPVNALRTE